MLKLQRKSRFHHGLLVAIGLVTFCATIFWSVGVVNLIRLFCALAPGGETNWPNLIAVLTTANILGVTPLVAGIVLLFRHPKASRI